MKILSLLPAATEILCELGLSESIVGISEECNYPDNIKEKPVASRIKFGATNSSKEIDEELNKIIKNNKSPFVLDRDLSEKRIYPSIDIRKSGTRREDKLMRPKDLSRIWVLRKLLSDMSSAEAMDFLLDKLKRTKNNREFFDSMNN